MSRLIQQFLSINFVISEFDVFSNYEDVGSGLICYEEGNDLVGQ
jgi:hypothetical protein